MLYYILNRDFDIVDMVELYSSMIWTNRFWDVGDFELYLPATPKTVSLFSDAINNGYYIVSQTDLKHAMMPQKLEIETSRADGNYISVTGYDLKYILNRRIVWEYKNLGGEIEKELIRLVTANAVDPTNPDRKIPGLTISEERSGANKIISGGLFGENLAVAIKNRCKLYGCGWDIELDLENKQMHFKVLDSTDLSNSVIFSNEMENLFTTKYIVDKTQPKNIAYVNAQLTRYNEETMSYEPFDFSQIVTLSTTEGVPKELDRYELYVENNENYDNNQYSVSQYGMIIRENAKKELRNAYVRDEVSGEVTSNYNYKLGHDYNIGDIVRVKNEYGLMFRARVTEVIVSIAKNKNTVIPSFAIVDNMEEAEPIDPSQCISVILNEGGELVEDYLVTSDGELVMLPQTYESNVTVYTTEGGEQDLEYVYLEDEEHKRGKMYTSTRFDPDYDYKRQEKSKWA